MDCEAGLGSRLAPRCLRSPLCVHRIVRIWASAHAPTARYPGEGPGPFPDSETLEDLGGEVSNFEEIHGRRERNGKNGERSSTILRYIKPQKRNRRILSSRGSQSCPVASSLEALLSRESS